MAKKLYERVGETAYDGLLVDHFPPADVMSVTVKSGEGALKRGSVLAMDSTDGKMSFLAAERSGTLDALSLIHI